MEVTSSAPKQGNLFEQREPKKTTINTIQLTANVERLCVNKIKHKNIWSFDDDNLYPNKVRSILQRSPSAIAASNVFSEFITGEGFEGNNIMLNSDDLTVFDILRFITSEISIFKGFALHINYNIFGEKTGYNTIPYELCRLSIEDNLVYLKKDWSKYFGEKEEYPLFNDDPVIVKQQINDYGGIDKYPGQILYWKNTTKNIYTTAMCDSVLDDMQLEHEIGVYNLMNIQNNYPLSSIIKVAKNLQDQKSKLETQLELNRGKGAQNAGKSLIVEVMPAMEGMKDVKMIESLGRDNIDNLFKFQKESAIKDIFACYNQPLVLSGREESSMFDENKIVTAFDYYNSKVEVWRKDIEKVLGKIFRNSIFNIPENIQIKPKEYIVKRNTQETNNLQDGGDTFNNN